MPANTTVAHLSPLLNYIPRSAWYTVSPVNDPALTQPNATYHATNGSSSGGASVTFSWWGTGIWIYAVDRAWVGPYRVSLDGSSTDFDGVARPFGDDDDSDGNFVLFAASDIPAAQHNVRITTTAVGGLVTSAPALGIDHLIFESPLDEGQRIEHNDSACMWAPVDADVWQIDDVSRSTLLDFGRMQMNFTRVAPLQGAGIAIYGFLDATSAPFSVTVDGHTHTPFMPNVPVPASNSSNIATNMTGSEPILLFASMSLDNASHTLLLENNPLSTAVTRMSISYSIVFIAGDGDPSVHGFPKSERTTLVLASTLSALGLVLLAVVVWRALVHRRQQTARLTDEITARPFLAPPFSPFSPFSPSSSTLNPPCADAPALAFNQNPFASTSTLPESGRSPRSAEPSRREKRGWPGGRSGSGSGPSPGTGSTGGRGSRGDSGHHRERTHDVNPQDAGRVRRGYTSDDEGPITASFTRTPRGPSREPGRQQHGDGAAGRRDESNAPPPPTPRARRARSTDKTAATVAAAAAIARQSTRRRHRPRAIMVGSPGEPVPDVPSLPTSARLPPRSPPDVMLGDAYMNHWLRGVGRSEGRERGGRGGGGRPGDGGGGGMEMQLMPPPYRLLDMH
ncbi:hypothetical protein C8Q70DRAFT_933040 [Cubamyces menziesii]|nr:hypothetical protein C8Q70DRAFT_933040 [Cubamyces menziesii]